MLCMIIKVNIHEELKIAKEELLTGFREIIKNESFWHINKKWIRAKELQKLTGWSSSSIQTYRANGTLTFSKVGGTVFYDLEHLMNLLETNAKNNKH